MALSFVRCCTPLVQHVSNRRIFVSGQFKVYGISQHGIGTTLDKRDRTIRQRVSNPLRLSNGLPPVLKRPLCQTRFHNAYLYHQHCSDSTDVTARRYFRPSHSKHPTTVFKAECNPYGFGHPLLSRKAQKYFLIASNL